MFVLLLSPLSASVILQSERGIPDWRLQIPVEEGISRRMGVGWLASWVRRFNSLCSKTSIIRFELINGRSVTRCMLRCVHLQLRLTMAALIQILGLRRAFDLILLSHISPINLAVSEMKNSFLDCPLSLHDVLACEEEEGFLKRGLFRRAYFFRETPFYMYTALWGEEEAGEYAAQLTNLAFKQSWVFL